MAPALCRRSQNMRPADKEEWTLKLELVTDLYDHMAWADARVWATVLDCDAAREDSGLRDTLHHIHAAQRTYMRLWLEEELQTPHPQFERVPELYKWTRPYYAAARDCVRAFPEARLREPVPAAWAQRIEAFLGPTTKIPTLGDTLIQVPLHTQHHRAQIATRLRELGATPPLIDYIVWTWHGRPEPEWPAAETNPSQ